jgi:hypothetical protein
MGRAADQGKAEGYAESRNHPGQNTSVLTPEERSPHRPRHLGKMLFTYLTRQDDALQGTWLNNG